jgi:hypothetical protein
VSDDIDDLHVAEERAARYVDDVVVSLRQMFPLLKISVNDQMYIWLTGLDYDKYRGCMRHTNHHPDDVAGLRILYGSSSYTAGDVVREATRHEIDVLIKAHLERLVDVENVDFTVEWLKFLSKITPDNVDISVPEIGVSAYVCDGGKRLLVFSAVLNSHIRTMPSLSVIDVCSQWARIFQERVPGVGPT